MAIWREQVSNEGHVYAALAGDVASSAVGDLFDEHPGRPCSGAAEELAMEDDERWLAEASRNGSLAAMMELAKQGY